MVEMCMYICQNMMSYLEKISVNITPELA